MLHTILVFAFAVGFISYTECARILAVAPLPSYSHQVAFRPIWKELSLRGHSVTVVTTDPSNDSSLKNLTEIDIHDETYRIWRDSGIVPIMQNKNTQLNPFATAGLFIDLFSNLTKAVLENEGVKMLLNENITFDLVMTEPFLPAGLGFVDIYKSKLILITSLEAPTYLHQAMGNPIHPVLYPEAALPLTMKTYTDRVIATALTVFYKIFQSYYFDINTSLLRQYFGENISSMGELLNKANMLFVNVNPIFGGVRPVTPSTIYYGAGSHLEEEKPLPTVSIILFLKLFIANFN